MQFCPIVDGPTLAACGPRPQPIGAMPARRRPVRAGAPRSTHTYRVIAMWKLFHRDDSCPLPPDDRDWIESRLRWFKTEFGRAPREIQVILPTPEFFPDPYHGQPEDVWLLLTRVARYMGVSSEKFEISFYTGAWGGRCSVPSVVEEETGHLLETNWLISLGCLQKRASRSHSPGGRVPRGATLRPRRDSACHRPRAPTS